MLLTSTGKPAKDIWRYDFTKTTWEAVLSPAPVGMVSLIQGTVGAPTPGPQIAKPILKPPTPASPAPPTLPNPGSGSVLAASYDPVFERLLILEDLTEDNVRIARLWAYDLNLSARTTLGEWPRVGEFDRFELGLAGDGSWILASSRADGEKLKVLSLRVNIDNVVPLGRYETNGILTGPPRTDRTGIQLLVEEENATEIETERVKWKSLKKPSDTAIAECVR